MKSVAFSEDGVLGEGNGYLRVRVGGNKVVPVLRWTTNHRCPDILVVRNFVDTFVCGVNSLDVFEEALMFQGCRAGRGGCAGGGGTGLGHGRSRSGGA